MSTIQNSTSPILAIDPGKYKAHPDDAYFFGGANLAYAGSETKFARSPRERWYRACLSQATQIAPGGMEIFALILRSHVRFERILDQIVLAEFVAANPFDPVANLAAQGFIDPGRRDGFRVQEVERLPELAMLVDQILGEALEARIVLA
jgi:hypothetical protein